MKSNTQRFTLRPIGIIRSVLKERSEAPMQGFEGAPDAWRDVLRVRPRSDKRRRIAGVFATRSPDRPNPLGLHPVTVKGIRGSRLRIGPIEAIDGTPVVDLKPVLRGTRR